MLPRARFKWASMSKTILVTGASSEIGREFIRNVDPGTTILAHGHHGRTALEALALELPDREVKTMVADLSDAADLKRFADDVARAVACPDQFVHLAAPKLTYGRFRDLSLDDLQSDLAIQLHAAVALLRDILPKMAKRGSGQVVLVLSSVTLGTSPAFLSRYVIVKHALLGLLRATVAEYAPKGIRINAVSPGMTETQFLSEVPAKIVELAAEKNPSKRNATPADVAKAIRFLLSSEAAFVNGVNLPVTGGETF